MRFAFLEWDKRKYHTLDYELKKIFGKKVIKLSLNGGFSCPNRDGKIGTRGCLFCGETGSGEFAAPARLSIKEQINYQIETLKPKWKTNNYIAYYQNFTNTYGSLPEIKEKYNEPLSVNGVVGVAAATRPDSISDETMDFLYKFNKKTYFWLELGLQTIHERTSQLIRRGYDLVCFEDTLEKLNKYNIKTVVHLIYGLPYESKEDFLESIRYIANKKIWGIKIHLLYVQKGTDLEKYHNRGELVYPDREEYAESIVDALEILPPEMVIHRLTGDGKRELLIEPRWSLKKFEVLNEIDYEFKKRKSYQGIRYKKDTTK
jgi:radical SAM protein (TIGR01212 family)